jgi:hypothetical protein
MVDKAIDGLVTDHCATSDHFCYRQRHVSAIRHHPVSRCRVGDLLLAGVVIGAQYGARIGSHLKGEQLPALLAIIILAVCSRVAYEMNAMLLDSFSI